jgi:muconolactone delta-isomerase
VGRSPTGLPWAAETVCPVACSPLTPAAALTGVGAPVHGKSACPVRSLFSLLTSNNIGVGGRLIELYYCFGDYDGVALFQAPDETTAVAALLAVIAPGHVKTIKTTVLMTVPQTVEAMRKASGQSYSAPR